MLHLSTALHHWKTFISSPFFCHYFSVSSRQLCFNFLWLKKPFSTSTYSTRLEGTWLSSVLVAFLTYKYHLMCLGSLHQYCWKSCDAICMRHTQPNNGGRWRDGIAAAWCTAFRQTWGSWCCCWVFLGFFCVAIFKNGRFRDVVALMTHGVNKVTGQCVEACLLIPSNGKP